MPNDFTFYGDLVGTSSLYATSPKEAARRLDSYYDTVFEGLRSYYEFNQNRKVNMYSDSIVVTGDRPDLFIEVMAPVYCNLVKDGLLLRGGLVSGRLNFEFRITVNNFKKRLPSSDVLARAVSLEKKVKGSRLILENKIAQKILGKCPEWITLDGYARNPKNGNKDLCLQRALAPAFRDDGAYEVLYPVIGLLEEEVIEKRIAEFDYLIETLPKEIAPHYTETKNLYQHSHRRLLHQRGN